MILVYTPQETFGFCNNQSNENFRGESSPMGENNSVLNFHGEFYLEIFENNSP